MDKQIFGSWSSVFVPGVMNTFVRFRKQPSVVKLSGHQSGRGRSATAVHCMAGGLQAPVDWDRVEHERQYSLLGGLRRHGCCWPKTRGQRITWVEAFISAD
jgi:hypothetical protein